MSLLVPLVANSQETVGEGSSQKKEKIDVSFKCFPALPQKRNLVHWFSGMDKGTGPHLVQKEPMPTSGRADELASFLKL